MENVPIHLFQKKNYNLQMYITRVQHHGKNKRQNIFNIQEGTSLTLIMVKYDTPNYVCEDIAFNLE